MYYAISSSKIAKINRLGKVTQVLSLANTDYVLHHDFVLSSDGKTILALATSKIAEEEENIVEDRVVKINLLDGSVSEVVNFETLVPSLYEQATDLEEHSNNIGKLDPIHLNTIQVVDNGSIIVSSKETSTIMKLSLGQSSEDAAITYMMADDSIWEGIGEYRHLLLTKTNSFLSQAGQHSVTYETDETLKDGQYYLSMFSNNSTVMDSRSSSDDWENFGMGTTAKKRSSMGETSYYYRYLVDETEGTYTLIQSFKVPYSAYISSVEQYNDNIIVDSGVQASFAEYDENGTLIRRFSKKSGTKFIYRTYKMSFNGFYFA